MERPALDDAAHVSERPADARTPAVDGEAPDLLLVEGAAHPENGRTAAHLAEQLHAAQPDDGAGDGGNTGLGDGRSPPGSDEARAVKRAAMPSRLRKPVRPIVNSRNRLTLATRRKAERLSTAIRSGRNSRTACRIRRECASRDALPGSATILRRRSSERSASKSRSQPAAFRTICSGPSSKATGGARFRRSFGCLGPETGRRRSSCRSRPCPRSGPCVFPGEPAPGQPAEPVDAGGRFFRGSSIHVRRPPAADPVRNPAGRGRRAAGPRPTDRPPTGGPARALPGPGWAWP